MLNEQKEVVSQLLNTVGIVLHGELKSVDRTEAGNGM
jgi:hypothetical protein